MVKIKKVIDTARDIWSLPGRVNTLEIVTNDVVHDLGAAEREISKVEREAESAAEDLRDDLSKLPSSEDIDKMHDDIEDLEQELELAQRNYEDITKDNDELRARIKRLEDTLKEAGVWRDE